MKPIIRWVAPRFAAAVVVLGLSVGGVSGCPSLGPTPPPGTPGFVNCSDTALHQAELNLLPSLENAVAVVPFSSAEATIATIVANEAASVGAPLALAEANCVLQWILSKAQAAAAAAESAGTKADSLEATKAANISSWLAAHPANISAPVTFQ